MHTKLYFIDSQLAISPKPRGGEDLAEEVAHWASEGISLVVRFHEVEGKIKNK